jgi:hypothetical protein
MRLHALAVGEWVDCPQFALGWSLAQVAQTPAASAMRLSICWKEEEGFAQGDALYGRTVSTRYLTDDYRSRPFTSQNHSWSIEQVACRLAALVLSRMEEAYALGGGCYSGPFAGSRWTPWALNYIRYMNGAGATCLPLKDISLVHRPSTGSICICTVAGRSDFTTSVPEWNPSLLFAPASPILISVDCSLRTFAFCTDSGGLPVFYPLNSFWTGIILTWRPVGISINALYLLQNSQEGLSVCIWKDGKAAQAGQLGVGTSFEHEEPSLGWQLSIEISKIVTHLSVKGKGEGGMPSSTS